MMGMMYTPVGFDGALRDLKLGKFVGKFEWRGTGRYLAINETEDGVFRHGPDGLEPFSPTWDEMMAGDWISTESPEVFTVPRTFEFSAPDGKQPADLTVISADRGRGKSTMLARWLMKNPETRVVLVANTSQQESVRAEIYAEAQHVAAVAVVMRVILFSQARDRLLSMPPNLEIAIDNLEFLFSEVLGWQPTVVTTSVPVRTMSIPQFSARSGVR